MILSLYILRGKFTAFLLLVGPGEMAGGGVSAVLDGQGRC
jgi:hypothetical protein